MEIEKALGYLNFSTGNHDPAFFIYLEHIYAALADRPDHVASPAQVRQFLQEQLDRLQASQGAFANSQQALRVISLCFDTVLPAYREFHRDVLFHQDEAFLFNSFFIGRVFEAVLFVETSSDRQESFVDTVLRRLNDYVGHRPLPALETHKAEAYRHEWIRPVPLYIKGAGVALGPYSELVRLALQILERTSSTLLWEAQFDLSRLQELAVDPRPLDFDHPVNRRPNHHFGQWDENSVNLQGDYSRFIVHRVTLDALLDRVRRDEAELPRSQLMFEAGAVLACTILMGSGISGRGPGAYDSSISLGKLIPLIVAYRDQFYNDLLAGLPEEHCQRLTIESQSRHQAFGAARQDINHQLALVRDRQLIRCRLSAMYARMGYDQAALEQADFVAVASARINCHIDCRLSALRRAILQGALDQAIALVGEIFELLQRGIDCGAIVDPWSILGFDGNYPLSAHAEDSIRDHRVDDLVDLMNYLFSRCARVWADAAASDHNELCQQIREQFLHIANWWRRYAAHEVLSVEAIDPLEAYDSAELVARALQLWHRGGAAAGSIEFWAQHAELFDSASAYWLVVQALLDRDDFVTSQALLIHWLSQADAIPLAQPDASFHDLVRRWLIDQRASASASDPEATLPIWQRIRKFYDFLEVNAGPYWQVPSFVLGRSLEGLETDDVQEWSEDSDEGDDEQSLLGAAYDDVIYQSETDDGFEGSVYQPEDELDAELVAEGDRILDRLQFHDCLATLWEVAATFPLPNFVDRMNPLNDESSDPWRPLMLERLEAMSDWIDHALSIRQDLRGLLRSISAHELPAGGVDRESLEQYDRHRLFKETLVQHVIESWARCENAVRALGASRQAIQFMLGQQSLDLVDERLEDERQIVSVYAAVLLRSPPMIVERFPELVNYLLLRRLLYVPLARGGDPEDIVQFRATQSALRDLLNCLPGLGLLVETMELTETAMAMERNWPVDQGAITEFDELFRVAYSALVTAIIRSAQQANASSVDTESGEAAGPQGKRRKNGKANPDLLFDCIEGLTQSMLILWLDHSRTLRLSVLERVFDRRAWAELVKFIQSYGGDLFDQMFLRLSNIRAILHQGVDAWLYQMQRSDLADPPNLLGDINREVTHKKAVKWLTLILESIIENYARYQEYNATTTQSDRGELLFVLLDFLRLEKQYDRVCWHLRPVIWAHQAMVRMHEAGVAKSWRRSLVERVGPEAESFLNKLQKLREKYSVKLPSLGDHLEGRFVQPMYVDRLVALVATAMHDPSTRKSNSAFEIIAKECQTLLEASAGVGMRVPDWLAALENEVDHIMFPERREGLPQHLTPMVEPLPISMEHVFQQLAMLPKRAMDP